MLVLLSRSHELTPIVRVSQPYRSLLRSFTSSHFSRSRSTFFSHQIDMATNKDAEMSRSGAQLKVPKGTRDLFGADMILRDHVLYVVLWKSEFGSTSSLTHQQPDNQRGLQTTRRHSLRHARLRTQRSSYRQYVSVLFMNCNCRIDMLTTARIWRGCASHLRLARPRRGGLLFAF